ncbi:MAG: hypothetical protein ACK480_13345, partial [Planctomycetota bacterium]
MRKAPCMHAINKLICFSILLLLSSTQGYSQELLANRFRGDQGLGVYQQCRVEIPWKDQSVTKLD